MFSAQKNRLFEMVLLCTHNICFGLEIRKNIFSLHILIKGLTVISLLCCFYFSVPEPMVPLRDQGK